MRLISFGCSLSRQGSNSFEIPDAYDKNHTSGLIHQTAKLLDVDYKNYSISSSGIDEQIYRFHNYMATEYDKDDVILWQMTGLARETITRALCQNKTIFKIKNKKYTLPKNSIDNVKGNYEFLLSKPKLNVYVENYLTFLSHSELVHSIFWDAKNNGLRSGGMVIPYERRFWSVIGIFKIIQHMKNPLLVWFGWKDCMLDYNELFENELIKNNIDFVAERYLEWSVEHGYKLTDSTHPCPVNTAPIFAKNIIYPKLRKVIEASQ